MMITFELFFGLFIYANIKNNNKLSKLSFIVFETITIYWLGVAISLLESFM